MAVPALVILTTSGATSDEHVVSMTMFQYETTMLTLLY